MTPHLQGEALSSFHGIFRVWDFRDFGGVALPQDMWEELCLAPLSRAKLLQIGQDPQELQKQYFCPHAEPASLFEVLAPPTHPEAQKTNKTANALNPQIAGRGPPGNVGGEHLLTPDWTRQKRKLKYVFGFRHGRKNSMVEWG